jgi:hypothetical protein
LSSLEQINILESDSIAQSTGNVSNFPFCQQVTAKSQENFAHDTTQQNFTIESQLFDNDDKYDNDQPSIPTTATNDNNDDNNKTQFFDPTPNTSIISANNIHYKPC